MLNKIIKKVESPRFFIGCTDKINTIGFKKNGEITKMIFCKHNNRNIQKFVDTFSKQSKLFEEEKNLINTELKKTHQRKDGNYGNYIN